MTIVLIITMRRNMLIIFITVKLTTRKTKTKTKANVLRCVILKSIILPYSLTEKKVHS